MRTAHASGTTIHLIGALGPQLVADFAREVRAVRRDGEQTVIVDVRHAEPMDAAAFGHFLKVLRAIRDEGGDVRILARPRSWLRLLAFARFDDVILVEAPPTRRGIVLAASPTAA